MNYDLILNNIFMRMIEHERAVPRRVGHFVKVASFARNIALSEGLDQHEVFLITAAGLVHDIGIKSALEKYNSSAGKYQEELGAEPAGRLLRESGVSGDDTDRICFLVAHHHSYNKIDGTDFQILVEADFLVNIYEDMMEQNAVQSVYEKYIKTISGKKLFENLFLNNNWKTN